MRRWIKSREMHIVIWGIIGALLTLLIGFTSMYIFWINDIQNPNIRGFFSYKAATYGDGICLPFLVGFSIVCLLYGGKEKFEFFRPCILVGVVGAVIGIIVQGSWLISDKTLPNWTIPEVHHFTAAGYYHAFFFVLMFGYIGFAFSAIWKLRRKKIFSYKQEFCFWGMISAGSGFLYCLALDDWTVNNTVYNALFKAFLVVFLSMVLFSSSSSLKRFRRDFGLIISAEGFSLAIVIAALNHGTNLYFCFFAIAEAMFTIILIKPDLYRLSRQILSFLIVACPLFTANMALYSVYQINDSRMYLFFIVIISVDILIATCLTTYDKLFKECLPLFFLIPLYLLISTLLKNNDDNALENIRQIADGLASLGIYFILRFYIKKKLFCIIQRNDEDMTLSQKHDEEIKLSIYFNIMIALMGAVLLFYNIMILSFDDLNNSDILNISILKCIIKCALLLVCSLICTVLLQKMLFQKVRKILSIIGLGGYYIFLDSTVLSLSENLQFDLGILLSVFPTLGASWMAAKGYYNNLLNLKGVENKKIDRITQGIIFLGNTVCAFSVSNIIFSTKSTVNASLLFLANIIILFYGFVIGPTISGIVNEYSYVDTKFIREKSYIGIAQDGFLSLLIIMLAGMIPMYYYRQLSSQDVITQIVGFIVGIAAIIAVIYWPYRYCLENNISHYKIKCKEYNQLILQQPENEKVLAYQKQSLKRHLSFQNRFSYIAVFPYLFMWDGVQKIINKYTEKKELFFNLAFKDIS